jgi:hypothetical protein
MARETHVEVDNVNHATPTGGEQRTEAVELNARRGREERATRAQRSGRRRGRERNVKAR